MASTGKNGNSAAFAQRALPLAIAGLTALAVLAAVLYLLLRSDYAGRPVQGTSSQNGFYEKAKQEYAKGNYSRALAIIRSGMAGTTDAAVRYNAELLAGVIYGANGNTTQAFAVYDRLLKRPTAELYHNRGVLFSKRGAVAEAIASYEAAIKLNKRFVPSLVSLGDIYARMRSYRLALEYYKRALAAGTKDKHVLVRIGMLYYENGEHEQAIAALRSAVDEYDPPMAARVYAYLGSMYAAEGSVAIAAEHYLKSLKFNPSDTAVMYNLSVIYINQGKYDRAAEVLAGALARDPKNRALMRSLGEVTFHAGDYTKSISYYKALAGMGYERYESMAMLADLHYRLGELIESEKYYRYIIDAARHDAVYKNAVLNLANVYADLGRGAEATATAERAIAENGDDPAAYYNAGVITMTFGDARKAIMLLNRSFELDTNSAKPLYRIAEYYERMRRDDYALARYQDIIKRFRDDYTALFRVAVIAYRMNNIPMARRHFEYVASRKNEFREDALLNLGIICDTQGDDDKALEYYTEAAVENPKQPLHHYNLGMFFYTRGQYTSAMEKFKLARAYGGPTGKLASAVYLAMGNTQAKLKDYAAAESFYLRSLDADRRNGEASFNLKQVRMRSSMR
ncbi:MAG: tetratricopeptide repeat protein [Spirochaetes bacterium]|nr:tetratricopeptide repeat protein [Spirochaetota bacterium]